MHCLLLALALTLALGCRQRLTRSTDTALHRTPLVPATAIRGGPRWVSPHERSAAIARGPVPGFAGEIAEDCTRVVLLTDTARQAAAARAYFRTPFQNCSGRAGLAFRQVRYDFAQLYDWYYGPYHAIWQRGEVRSTSIDVWHNQLAIGVRDSAAASRVRRLADSLAIPKDAVRIEGGMYACVGTGGPSVVVEVRDQSGRPAAVGTTMVIQDGAFKDSVDGAHALDALRVGAGERRPGTYEARLYKAGYKPVVLHDVRAPGDTICRYATPSDIRKVTLELMPDVPRVRSIIVFPPAMGFGLPGLTTELRAVVDADAGLSNAVRWSSSDTTVAPVSPAALRWRAPCGALGS